MGDTVDNFKSDIPWELALMFIFIKENNFTVVQASDLSVVVEGNVDGTNYRYELSGTNLKVDFDNNKFKGKLTSIKILDADEINNVTETFFIENVSLKKLNEAVDAAKKELKVEDTLLIEDLIQAPDLEFPGIFYRGGDQGNTAKGYFGDDVFEMGGGSDMLYASKGDDWAIGGAGKDTYIADFFNTSANINLNKEKAKIGNHTDTIQQFENIVGTSKNDTLTGDSKKNDIRGGDGKDTIKGGGANDVLNGGKGSDKIDGGKGKDKVTGGKGNDKLKGGSDADTFIFDGSNKAKNGKDTIQDYEVGLDIIEIKGGKKSEVSVSTQNGNTIIDYDQGEITLIGNVLTKGQIDFEF